jgi:nitronate monooxygenase
MTIPSALARGLRLPVIAAPMFLVSDPRLVIAACRAGVIGTFPALNQRSSDGFRDWLEEIEAALGPDDARFGVNLIIHHSNVRLDADLAIVAEHRVPLIITSIGIRQDLVAAVHDYGGLVFHDVISARHAERALEAGVDGLILVCAGAGGHCGPLNPFALMAEARRMFDGPIALSGALSTGRDIAAARMMGADFAYMGTRFIATAESGAAERYKAMITASSAVDVACTRAVSGIPASFMRPSLSGAGVDADTVGPFRGEARPWKDIWSAGQGVGAIDDLPSVSGLVDRLEAEYDEAVAVFSHA